MVRINFINSLPPQKTTLTDTVIYKYISKYSKGDTIIGDYKMSCIIRPNGDFLPVKYYGDSIAYVNEDTELSMDVYYKDSVILSTILARKRFQEYLDFPDDNFQNYALYTVTDFRVERDTFKMEISVNIPDTDLFYLFELSIANNGKLLIRDITPEDGEDCF